MYTPPTCIAVLYTQNGKLKLPGKALRNTSRLDLPKIDSSTRSIPPSFEQEMWI